MLKVLTIKGRDFWFQQLEAFFFQDLFNEMINFIVKPVFINIKLILFHQTVIIYRRLSTFIFKLLKY